MGGVESSTSTAAFPTGGSKSMISKMINGYESVIHSSCPFSWSFKWIEFPTLQRHKTKFLLLFKMFENFMHTSPGPENGCGINTLSDSGSMIPLTGDNGKKYVRINHKKWELRRLRSLDKVHEILAGNGRFLKKQRPTYENNDVDCTSKPQTEAAKECWNRKSAVASVWLASSSSNRLVKSDVVLQETSRFFNEENEGKKNMQDYVPCCRSHWSISVIGRRREMEDAVAMELGFLRRGTKEYYDFFGVYDGHGGSRVAQACRDRLHKLVGQVVGEKGDSNINEDGGGGINWDKVMLESFKKMDEEVDRIGAAVATMGSTAVVAVVGEEEVVVANCGDSRAVLSRGGAAIPLSHDHKPERPDELDRIELSGGKVIDWNGHRILGVLATSRSIGDNYLKPFVISEPEVTVSRRTDADEFLILASDGLWDVISNDVACHVVRRCLHGQVRRGSRTMASGKKFSESSTTEGRANHEAEGDLAAEASSILAELAIARGSRDNISVIVIQLKRSASLGANRLENFSGTKEEIS